MKVIDLYSGFINAFEKNQNLEKVMQTDEYLKNIYSWANEWGIDLKNVETWIKSFEYKKQKQVAENFIKQVPEVVKKVENTFGEELKGEIKLSPSLMRFDGFARYDAGEHHVLFGVDHPDADENYLKVLMAHELSHVYRDHQPRVWGFLGKELREISRQEYLDNMSAEEHLASEGLATLLSQVVFPQVPLHVHHYYYPEEMTWCLENKDLIEKAIFQCLKGDQNVWKFYEDGAVTDGSPSRVQYFWGAQRIRLWLEKKYGPENYQKALIQAHSLSAKEFECFDPNWKL